MLLFDPMVAWEIKGQITWITLNGFCKTPCILLVPGIVCNGTCTVHSTTFDPTSPNTFVSSFIILFDHWETIVDKLHGLIYVKWLWKYVIGSWRHVYGINPCLCAHTWYCVHPYLCSPTVGLSPPWPRQLITPILLGFLIRKGCMVIQITPNIQSIVPCIIADLSWNFHQNPIIICLKQWLDFKLGSQHGDPDHNENEITCSFYHLGPLHKISSQSFHNFLSNIAKGQTDRKTNKHTNKPMLLKT